MQYDSEFEDTDEDDDEGDNEDDNEDDDEDESNEMTSLSETLQRRMGWRHPKAKEWQFTRVQAYGSLQFKTWCQ